MKVTAIVLALLALTAAAANGRTAGTTIHTIGTRGALPSSTPQRQMPDGSVYTSFSVADRTPANSKDWQSNAIVGWEDNYSPYTSAVGVWGSAMSYVRGGKVWGGFMSAYSDADPQGKKDSQLVGLEVDVANGSLPGVAPNRSKSALQLVGLGNENTSAVEILSHHGEGEFRTGIDFENDAVTNDGTLIGASGPGPYGLGIDLTNARFTDAAVRVGPEQKIRLDSTDSPAQIFTEGNKLVIVVPSGGVEYRDSSGNVLARIP